MSKPISKTEYLALKANDPVGASRKNKRVEGDVQKQIRAYLNSSGIYHERLQSGKLCVTKTRRNKAGQSVKYSHYVQCCEAGTPDLIVIYRCHAIFIETKKPGGTADPKQLAMHQKLRTQAEAIVFVADSLPDFIEKWQVAKAGIDAVVKNINEHFEGCKTKSGKLENEFIRS